MALRRVSLVWSPLTLQPLETATELPGPTPLEDRIIAQASTLNRDLVDGPLNPNGTRQPAPWRLASERKVVGVEIESYSDRYRRPTAAASGGTSGGGATAIDAAALHLNESLFPPALWAEYFAPQAASAKAKDLAEKARARKRRRLLEGKDDDDDAEKSEKDSEAEGEDDFDFDDEEEEDHQDYDHNYFETGSADDDDGGEPDGDGECDKEAELTPQTRATAATMTRREPVSRSTLAIISHNLQSHRIPHTLMPCNGLTQHLLPACTLMLDAHIHPHAEACLSNADCFYGMIGMFDLINAGLMRPTPRRRSGPSRHPHPPHEAWTRGWAEGGESAQGVTLGPLAQAATTRVSAASKSEA